MLLTIVGRNMYEVGFAGDDSTLTIELAAIENSIEHSGNEIDMTDMKNTE